MEKLIEFYPGYDKRDPDPAKNYGIGGMKIKFVLKGRLGATDFALLTNWYPLKVQKELFDKGEDHYNFFWMQPSGEYVGYHSPTPQHEDQWISTDNCPYLDGKPCYADGGALWAEELTKKFLVSGVDAVWSELEEAYTDRFGKLE